MPVLHKIGAGGRIYIATAAAPETVSGITTYNMTKYVKQFAINPAIATDNVTTLDADVDNFAERFIAALINSTGSLNVLWGAPQGTFRLALRAIINGSNHTTAGRGGVNWLYDPWGTVQGYLRISGTLLFTTLPLTGALGTAIGGDVNFQCTGEVTEAAVPAQPES